MTRPAKPDGLDDVRTDPDEYVATAFLGRGRYDTRRAPTLAAARSLAELLILEHGLDRPVAPYALKNGRQAHVENVAPRR